MSTKSARTQGRFEMDHADTQIKKLTRMLGAFTEEQEADAAVALLLRVVNQRLEALFVKRVERPTDPWSGQIALPGGKREAEDESLRQTVIRETLEETGIDLLHGCRILGVLETTKSGVKPEIRVLPVVVLLEHQPSINLSRKELEWFAWIPVKELIDHEGTVKFSFGEFPAYVVGNNAIWGMTYRIAENLLRILEKS
jgi:8-oxo-dGTP pyrophosphatase MutT (NUDIX family)